MLDLKLENIPAEEWAEFILRYPHTIFQDPVWGKVVSEGYNSEMLFFVLKKNGENVLGLSGNILNLKIMNLFFSTYPYGGFVGDMKYRDTLLELLAEELKKRGVHRIRLTGHSDYAENGLKGYSRNLSYLHFLDLKRKTSKALWSDYKSRIRRDVSKARRSGIKVKRIEKEEEIHAYYRLYLDTMKRNRSIGPHPEAFYKALYSNLILPDKATILFAEYQGRYISGVVLIFSDDICYLLGNVSSQKYLTLCPSDLLVHLAIEESITRKMSGFDFMTSSSSDINLMNFKEKWGAGRHDFYTFEKNLSIFKPGIWDFIWGIMNLGICKTLVSCVSGTDWVHRDRGLKDTGRL